MAVLHALVVHNGTGWTHLCPAPTAFDPQHLIERLAFENRYCSCCWEINSAHVPADDLLGFQMTPGRCSNLFESYSLPRNVSIGFKLCCTPWVPGDQAPQVGTCQDEVDQCMHIEAILIALARLLMLAGEADVRILILDPDAAVLPGLLTYTDDKCSPQDPAPRFRGVFYLAAFPLEIAVPTDSVIGPCDATFAERLGALIFRIPIMLSRLFCSAALSLAFATTVGCTTTRHAESLSEQSGPATDASMPLARPLAAATAPVRYIPRGRYGMESTAPRAEQADPLQQIIEIRVAPTLASSVQDALSYLLQRSGYVLCADTPRVHPLFTRPLPSVHYALGPISLRDALQTLAGAAWQLEVDPLLRVVCFSPRLTVIEPVPLTHAEVQP